MARSKAPARFVEIYTQKTPGISKVLVDMATGVNYFFHSESDGYGGAGGLTPLLNQDGTPVITPPEMFMNPQ